MSKSEAYRGAIEAVINSQLDHPMIFEVLDLLYSEYRSAKWSEEREAKLKQSLAETEGVF